MKKTIGLTVAALILLTGCGNQEEVKEPKEFKKVESGLYVTEVEYQVDDIEYRFAINGLGIYQTDNVTVDFNSPLKNAPTLEVKEDGTNILHVRKDSDVSVGYEQYTKARRREANSGEWDTVKSQMKAIQDKKTK